MFGDGFETEARDHGQAGIQSVEVAGTVLQALIASDRPQRLSEIAKAAGLPAAKVHRYLVSLVRIGLATQDVITGRYDLGPTSLKIGLSAFNRFDVLRVAAEILDETAARLGETAALVVWGEHGPKFVRMVEARHTQASTVPITHVCPMTWSATGLLFACYEDPSRTGPLIARELEQNRLLKRQDSPHDQAALLVLLDRIRRLGVATVLDGGGSGISGISAPVFDTTGKLTMGLTVFARTGRVTTEEDDPLVSYVRAAAAQLSRSFGFAGAPSPPPPQPRAPRRARS